MEPQFWHDRWQVGELGWHLDDVNPLLEQYWPQLGVDGPTKVLVPLCGKSKDMLWLAEQGHTVLGVELSRLGAEAFFTESGLVPRIVEDPPFVRYSAGSIDILCGDFFDLVMALVADVGAVYDRGALVALAPSLRERYVAHLQALLEGPRKSLLISFDYLQHEMNGPPFAVGTEAVRQFFGATHHVERLAAIDALAENPRFRERGVSRMDELVFALIPRSS